MKRIIPIIALCGLLLTSCSTQRQIAPRRYQTLSQKANATLQFDQHKYPMGCTVQLWHNELVVLSLQPMLGIEMVRIEASKDSVFVFDKMNRRYTALAYNDFEKQMKPTPSFKLIQDFVTTPQIPENKTKSQINFMIGKHNISIACTFSQRIYNTLKEAKRLDTNKYKRVSLREVLPL